MYNAHSKAALTTAPIATVNGAIKPEFIRLPKAGTLCPWTGLTRSKLNELILPTEANGFRPAVTSKVLRQRGRVKGVRLIVFDRLMEYLRSIPDAADEVRAA